MKHKSLWIGVFALIAVLGTYLTVKNDTWMAETKKTKTVIALDAGHGGFDPGKVGVNQALEKDINLAITLELRDLLEKKGYQVVMTRETDTGLYTEGDSNKKRADMNKRVSVINESGASIAISIHQNSFSQESSHGVQVFYHQQSEEGKNLALVMQKTIKEIMDDGNHREAKSNDSYYMLRQTQCPLVIVECGFLSNWKEAGLLITEEYQKKMAQAIFAGMEAYLNTLY